MFVFVEWTVPYVGWSWLLLVVVVLVVAVVVAGGGRGVRHVCVIARGVRMVVVVAGGCGCARGCCCWCSW